MIIFFGNHVDINLKSRFLIRSGYYIVPSPSTALGWIMNTVNHTVKGQIEGDSGNVETMKKWLRTNGSPKSRIDKAVFSCEKDIGQYSFESKAFEIHR